MARRIHTQVGGPVTTVSTATQTLAEWDLAAEAIDGCCIHVEGVLIGKQGTTASVTTRVARAFHRQAGTLTALGSLASLAAPIGSAALLTAAGVLDTSGNLIRLRATGVNGINLEWTGYLYAWTGEYSG